MHSSIIMHNFYHVVFVMMSQEAPEKYIVGYIRNPNFAIPEPDQNFDYFCTEKLGATFLIPTRTQKLLLPDYITTPSISES